MIWRNTVTNKAERDWQSLVHVNASLRQFGHDPVRRVEAGRAGPDNGQAEWSVGLPGDALRDGEAPHGSSEMDLMRWPGSTPAKAEKHYKNGRW